MEQIIPPVTAREIGFILYKRRWSISLILLGTLLGTILYLFLIREDLYAVSARLLVKIGREQAPPPSVLGATPQVVGYRTTEVNSEIEILQSSQLLMHLIDDLGLDKPGPPPPVPKSFLPRLKSQVSGVVRRIKDWEDNVLIAAGLRERLTPRERVLSTLQDGLVVKAAKDSNVFVAVLSTPYRHGGSQVLDALLDRYLQFRQKLYGDAEYGFFQNQVAASLGELRSAEEQLQKFEDQNNISLLAKQEETLIEQISRERVALQNAEILRAAALFRVQRLDTELKKRDPNLGSVGDFPRESFQQNILNQLADLQREKEKLLYTELDDSDRVQNNRSQFRALVSMLAANLRSALDEAENTAAAQRATVARLEDELHSRHAATEQWNAMRRRVSDLEETYIAYQKKLSQTRADQDMERLQLSNVAVIEHPIDPIKPVGVRKTTLLEISMLVALFTALAWVAIAEFFDQRAYSSTDLERYLGAPVLTEVAGWRRR